jgi:hypothetical protein
MGDHSGLAVFRVRHRKRIGKAGSRGNKSRAESKRAGIKKARIKKADLGPAVFQNTITLTGCPGRARLHPGYRSYFFFDFLAFFAFFAFFAFLAIASSFELMD